MLVRKDSSWYNEQETSSIIEMGHHNATNNDDTASQSVSMTGFDPAYYLSMDDDEEIDPVEEKKLVLKTDLILCPMMCLVYAIQFMDKTASSYAAIMGLRTDLGMKGNMYSWAGTSFYLGYFIFSLPACFILQRFPVAKTITVFLVLWGIILICTAFCNYAGFIACRTLLGMLESGISPAFVLLTSQWYRREEQTLRTSFWVSSNGFGKIIACSIGYALAYNEDKIKVEAWKVLFILLGILTIIFACAVLIVIPDSPLQAKFLNYDEKKLVVKRLRANQQGVGNRTFKLYQFKEAFIDPRTWIMFVSAVSLNIPNGAISNFASILIHESMGYSTLKTLLMNMPSGAVEFVGVLFFGYFCHKIDERMLTGGLAIAISLIGSSMLAFSENVHVELAGYYILVVAPVAMMIMFALVSSNVAGHTKKVTVNAVYLIGYAVGNMVGPQTFRDKEAPDYVSAKVGVMACYAVCLLCFPAMYLLNWRENRRRDMTGEGYYGHEMKQAFADLTDMENKEFRYTL